MSLGDLDGPAREFLLRLFELTQGDPGRQASMYAVGDSLGMDRPSASATAQDLMGLELVQIRSLSGAIGISAEGAQAVRAASGDAGPGALPLTLGSAPVTDPARRQVLEQVLSELKARAGALGLDFDSLAELMADIKSLSAQLDSPRPKTAILRECLRSVAAVLKRAAPNPCLAKIQAFLGN